MPALPPEGITMGTDFVGTARDFFQVEKIQATEKQVKTLAKLLELTFKMGAGTALQAMMAAIDDVDQFLSKTPLQ
jgi:hypothetical protein